MYCHIEGVNFDATVFDTQDISTIRGSSLLLEDLHHVFGLGLSPYRPEKVEFGGAKALFRLPNGTDEPAVRQTISEVMAKAPWCHMSVVYGFGDTPETALRAARIMQYQSWSVPDPGDAGERPCALDLKRPAQVEIANPSGGKRLVSHSVAARRQQGTRARPDFLNRDGFRTPYDFDEMLGNPTGVPEMIQGKMAVIYADGIGGSTLRGAYNDKTAFSDAMKDMRQTLAEALNDWAETPGVHREAGTWIVPRFDTLLWGGDDMTFVMPAWLALPFLHIFFDVTEHYMFRPQGGTGRKLHHRAACIIANKKTPIRQMRALAQNAEVQVKSALEARQIEGSGAFTIDVFESAALPHAEILPYRIEQYGSGYSVGQDVFVASDVERIEYFCAELTDDDADGLTRTLLHGALADMRHIGATACSPSGNEEVLKRLKDHFQRVHGEDVPDHHLMTSKVADLSSLERPTTSLALAQIAQLLPYTGFSAEGAA
ncbi:hypothetical protein [Marinovum sp. KMM 9879]